MLLQRHKPKQNCGGRPTANVFDYRSLSLSLFKNSPLCRKARTQGSDFSRCLRSGSSKRPKLKDARTSTCTVDAFMELPNYQTSGTTEPAFSGTTCEVPSVLQVKNLVLFLFGTKFSIALQKFKMADQRRIANCCVTNCKSRSEMQFKVMFHESFPPK